MIVRAVVISAYLTLSTTAYSVPSFPEYLPIGRLSHSQKPLRNSFDAWVETEEHIALERLLANVKPGGRNVEGQGKHVADGTVVASPSTEGPDYWYQCMNCALSLL